jgi:hypothetical protein
MIDPNRSYHRVEIDKVFTKTKAALKRGGDGLALFSKSAIRVGNTHTLNL